MGIRTFCLRRKIVRRCRPLCPLSLNLLVNVEGHTGGNVCRVLPEIVSPPPPFISIIFPGIREILKSVVKFFRNRSSIPEPAPVRLAKW